MRILRSKINHNYSLFIIHYSLFFRTVEAAGPYINEVCANIVRSTVGRGLAPAVFGNTLVKSLALGERWRR